jgi:hypothetical protein
MKLFHIRVRLFCEQNSSIIRRRVPIGPGMGFEGFCS